MRFLEKYSHDSSVQDTWDDIKSNLMGALDACVPSKMSSTRHNQPWITRELKQLRRRKKKAFTVIFLPAHPESCTHIFCFGTHILNLSESQYS